MDFYGDVLAVDEGAPEILALNIILDFLIRFSRVFVIDIKIVLNVCSHKSLGLANQLDQINHAIRYPVDITEEDDHVFVDAEMPGFKNEEIDVSINDDILSIQAERTTESPKGRPYLQERHFSCLQRTFRLPSSVDPDSVDAKLEGGVLHMEMKKSESARTRKIEVK